jgi:hypothetical protein
LLDELNIFLGQQDSRGMLFLDSRASQHSSIQDRRLIDAYSEWANRIESRFVELPIFGFSSFYSGLQLADCFGYLTNCIANEEKRREKTGTLYPSPVRTHDLHRAFDKFRARIVMFTKIP